MKSPGTVGRHALRLLALLLWCGVALQLTFVLRIALMTVVDETFMECPWYGSRQMARHLRRAGDHVG